MKLPQNIHQYDAEIKRTPMVFRHSSSLCLRKFIARSYDEGHARVFRNAERHLCGMNLYLKKAPLLIQKHDILQKLKIRILCIDLLVILSFCIIIRRDIVTERKQFKKIDRLQFKFIPHPPPSLQSESSS